MRTAWNMLLGAPARCRESTIRNLALIFLLFFSLVLLIGSSPSRAQPIPHPPILIGGDSEFTPLNGVTRGNGTIQTPYIIENWEITANTMAGIQIKNTHSFFVIRDVYIHPSTLTPESSGILLENAVNGRVENARIANFTYGVQLSLASQDTITTSKIWSNTYGIYMSGSDDIISNNHIYNNTKYALWVTSSFTSRFTGNNASANGNLADGAGFVVSTSSNDTFQNNTASGNSFYGFRIILSSNDVFRNNTVSKNQFGMTFTESSGNQAFENSLLNNHFGIGLENLGLEAQSNNNVTMNHVTGNGYGIYVVNSTRNLLYNNYLNNTSNAFDDSTLNAWNIPKTLRTNILGGPFQGGNFYSDYQGSDPDSDGLGDTPYPLQGGTLTHQAQDFLPMVRTQPTIVHDVAATSISTQPTSARAGTVISITATVFNEGTVSESFTVILSYNRTIIAARNVVNLQAWTGLTIIQTWTTQGLTAGTYLLTANASIVPGEIYTGNNVSPPTIVNLTLNQPPVAIFSISSAMTVAGKTISFDATASYDPDGTVVAYAWNFGDGSSTQPGVAPQHSYLAARTFTVTLTVTDNEGATASNSKSVTILSDQPSAPGNLVITATTAGSTLTWSPPGSTGGSPVTGYKIYRGTSPSMLGFLTTVGNVTSYDDGTVSSGQTFYYQITAVNEAGIEGARSATEDVLIPAPNASNLPSNQLFWYGVAIATVLAASLGGILVIRRRTRNVPSNAIEHR